MKLQKIVGSVALLSLFLSPGVQAASTQQLRSDKTDLRNGPFGVASAIADERQSPTSPRELLQVYQDQMNKVVEKTCADLQQIAGAVRNGTMTREQAEYTSIQRFQLGFMTFQLLRTLYESTAELAKTAQPADTPELGQNTPTIRTSGLAVAVPLPSSSDVSQGIVEYLGLKPVQVAAIQAQIETQRKETQPLLDKLSEKQGSLTAATLNGNFDEKRIRRLAAEQSKILEQLIFANAELEARIYETLSTEQRRKLDEIRKALDTGILQTTGSAH